MTAKGERAAARADAADGSVWRWAPFSGTFHGEGSLESAKVEAHYGNLEIKWGVIFHGG